MTEPGLGRRAAAESLGTAFLTLCIVGSGISATRLTPGDAGFQLVFNALATGLGLAALIVVLGSVSGAQLNPAITLVAWLTDETPGRTALAYVGAQFAGAAAGAVLANAIFGLEAFQLSDQARTSAGLWASEAIATLGLVLVIFGLVRSGRRSLVPLAVGSYITAAILFTSSTAFANPAATVARSLSDTFAGIAPGSVGMFVVAELVGAVLGLVTVRVLWPSDG